MHEWINTRTAQGKGCPRIRDFIQKRTGCYGAALRYDVRMQRDGACADAVKVGPIHAGQSFPSTGFETLLRSGGGKFERNVLLSARSRFYVILVAIERMPGGRVHFKEMRIH